MVSEWETQEFTDYGFLDDLSLTFNSPAGNPDFTTPFRVTLRNTDRLCDQFVMAPRRVRDRPVAAQQPHHGERRHPVGLLLVLLPGPANPGRPVPHVSSTPASRCPTATRCRRRPTATRSRFPASTGFAITRRLRRGSVSRGICSGPARPSSRRTGAASTSTPAPRRAASTRPRA